MNLYGEVGFEDVAPLQHLKECQSIVSQASLTCERLARKSTKVLIMKLQAQLGDITMTPRCAIGEYAKVSVHCIAWKDALIVVQ